MEEGRKNGQAERAATGPGGQMDSRALGAPQSASNHGTHWTRSQGGQSSDMSCRNERAPRNWIGYKILSMTALDWVGK